MMLQWTAQTKAAAWRYLARLRPAMLALCAMGVVGCNAPRDNLTAFNHQFETGRFESASSFAQEKLSKADKPGNDDLLWMLQLGVTERMQGRYARSNHWFDKSEELLQYYATDASALAQTLAAAVVNDNVIPYSGSIYDGIMCNTYKALNFMRQGDYDLARVEFNRAVDRQRRAKEEFGKQIEAVQEELNRSSHSQIAHKTLENEDFRTRLEQNYPNLSAFEAYPDFVNPFTTYLAGVFFAATNDYAKASDLLKESTGMLAGSDTVLRDFAAVEEALDTGRAIGPTVWVFFENGLGPIKEEVRIDLPLFVVTDKVRYFGIALPQLVFRPGPVAHLNIRTADAALTTELIADMDRIVQTEFKKEFDGILLRAILSATAKAVAQYAMEKNNASTAAILMALYNFASTSADVRIWSALPKNFQAARFARPADGQVVLAAGAHPPTTVQLPDGTHAIIYVKMAAAHVPLQVELMTF